MLRTVLQRKADLARKEEAEAEAARLRQKAIEEYEAEQKAQLARAAELKKLQLEKKREEAEAAAAKIEVNGARCSLLTWFPCCGVVVDCCGGLLGFAGLSPARHFRFDVFSAALCRAHPMLCAPLLFSFLSDLLLLLLLPSLLLSSSHQADREKAERAIQAQIELQAKIEEMDRREEEMRAKLEEKRKAMAAATAAKAQAQAARIEAARRREEVRGSIATVALRYLPCLFAGVLFSSAARCSVTDRSIPLRLVTLCYPGRACCIHLALMAPRCDRCCCCCCRCCCYLRAGG